MSATVVGKGGHLARLVEEGCKSVVKDRRVSSW
jgi:hypothetical protein